ncbi:hypothetical protein CRE_19673 [Caenorhabditis remanei]|uniref:Uncharacterized protein n=1 Tax=Caenorhabditis remanei TaxID=31234 RepID=E3MD95_CAERE|nr:hypothetical protein CRE_19673 [Caenorhabditis remanei]
MEDENLICPVCGLKRRFKSHFTNHLTNRHTKVEVLNAIKKAQMERKRKEGRKSRKELPTILEESEPEEEEEAQ